MKRVSFKVAKAIKEVGFPQEHKGYRYTTRKCRGRCVNSLGNNAWYEFDEGKLVDGDIYHLFQSSFAYAPTYRVTEVICINCKYRWVSVRPEATLLKELECPNCHKHGYTIETGEIMY